MPTVFKRGDHVAWNSEVGRVHGVILKKIVSDLTVEGYVHHASKDNPQYLVQSDKTDHQAIHKGPALRHLQPMTKQAARKSAKKK